MEESGGGDCMESLVGGGEGADVGVEPVEVLIETIACGAFAEELLDDGMYEGIWGGRVLYTEAASHSKLKNQYTGEIEWMLCTSVN